MMLRCKGSKATLRLRILQRVRYHGSGWPRWIQSLQTTSAPAEPVEKCPLPKQASGYFSARPCRAAGPWVVLVMRIPIDTAPPSMRTTRSAKQRPVGQAIDIPTRLYPCLRAQRVFNQNTRAANTGNNCGSTLLVVSSSVPTGSMRFDVG